MIRIKSKKQGFRRCGIEHTEKPKYYPDDHFTKEEQQILFTDSMLIVDRVKDDERLLNGEMESETESDNLDKEFQELKEQLQLDTEARKTAEKKAADAEKALKEVTDKLKAEQAANKKLEKEIAKLKKKGK